MLPWVHRWNLSLGRHPGGPLTPPRRFDLAYRFALLLLVLPLLTGCKSDCDKLCDEMASYWEECGLPVGDSAVSDCQEAWEQESSDGEDGELQEEKYRQQCKVLISNEENANGEMELALRARFTCREMCEGPGGNFDGPGGGVDCSAL